MNQNLSTMLPAHLPDKLSISFWYWAWVSSALPDEHYGHLERSMVELKDRGFNTVRVDAGLSWCFRLDGAPRGEIEFGPWMIGGSDLTSNPTGGGRGDGALAKFSPDGSKLLYATYLGGSGEDLIRSVALGTNGELYLVGSTSSKDFPVTPNAAQGKLAGNSDGFVIRLVPAP